jgi:hypothetical protein
MISILIKINHLMPRKNSRKSISIFYIYLVHMKYCRINPKEKFMIKLVRPKNKLILLVEQEAFLKKIYLINLKEQDLDLKEVEVEEDSSPFSKIYLDNSLVDIKLNEVEEEEAPLVKILSSIPNCNSLKL